MKNISSQKIGRGEVGGGGVNNVFLLSLWFILEALCWSNGVTNSNVKEDVTKQLKNAVKRIDGEEN